MAFADWSHVSVNDGLYRKPGVVPSIQTILGMDNITYTKMDPLINYILHLDGNCTPLLMGAEGKGGRWMFVETMFASEAISDFRWKNIFRT